ncbi:GntR family transcriptional regulator [Xylanimonas protaetiae]|uniref:GntR family transcriptional regulator n=1 Tax=Xylanimonas protaetiae TaxID=2509457 RepID=A0A4P6F0R6_9MICO|nr:GntR family transcriptional regulator [Xylanimonas protaetiae]QAY68796.1 GntR family transcriptional regulator [Xylanimonas protaetiae]
MTYGPVMGDLLDALHTLVADARRTPVLLDRATHGDTAARERVLAQVTGLREPVARALARLVTFAAGEEARHRAEATYEREVAQQAARHGARAGTQIAAALASPAPRGLADQIARHAAAAATRHLAVADGAVPSPQTVTETLVRRATERVAAGADLTDARRLADPALAGRLPEHAPATALATSARQLQALTRTTHAADLDGSPIPVVATWQAAARAAILLTERELPALGWMTVEQQVALTHDAAQVRDALTLLDTFWAAPLRTAGHQPWPALPNIPADPDATTAGIDHLGHHPTPPRPVTGDGLGETVWALRQITLGLGRATPHARAAEQVAAALTRISHRAAALDPRTGAWSTHATALDALWLELQDVHCGAGSRAAAPLADDAARALTALTRLDPDDATRLLTAVHDTAHALARSVAFAIGTHLYTVIVDYRPGPVVRATRTLVPVHQFATPATAPKLHDALASVEAATRHRPATPEDLAVDVADGARVRLGRLVATVSEATTPWTPRPAPPATAPQVAKIYAFVRDRIADGTYTGALPPAASLAHRVKDGSTAAARQALARLAAEHLITINPPGLGPAAAVRRPGPPTWAGVADRLRERITDRVYTGRLPSTRALAAELGVSTTVIHTAEAALAAQGLVVRVRGRYGGTFTADTTPTPAPTARWRAVYTDLHDKITRGTLTGRLPAMSVLAKQYEVSVSTVHQAVIHLTGEGLTYQRPGGPDGGTYVAPVETDPGPWQALADTLRTRIARGELSGRLPTPAALARAHDTDVATAARAVAQLAADGLLTHRISGNQRGLHVTAPTDREHPAVWRTIYTDLRAQITDGTLTGRLPSRRDLAGAYNTSTGPPAQAMRRLADDGLITLVTGTGPTAGAYVATSDPPTPRGETWTSVYQQIRDRIDDGTYTGRLPAVPDLVAAHHTTRAPVYKALRQLTAHGRIYTVNDGIRSGTFITPPNRRQVRSRRWDVYDDLRHRITTGTLTGYLPTLDHLARQYATGRKPVTYALARLTDEGLLARDGHRPTVVTLTQPSATTPDPLASAGPAL